MVRRLFTEGLGTPALIAVEQDASGRARDLALAYAVGIVRDTPGSSRRRSREETETDLFGEQAVLCGGRPADPRGFGRCATGYPPEITCSVPAPSLKLIVDLIWEGGLQHMRWVDLRHGRVRRLRERDQR